MRKKILITGIAGFIGSNLAKSLLKDGYDVVGIDNLSSGTAENIPDGVEFHRLDICDAKIEPLFYPISTVFHLAAKTCLPECIRDPVGTCRNNIEGTIHILEAVRKTKVPQMIYADTSAEYEGINVFPSPVNLVAPQGVYAVSKRSGALFCESYQKLHGLNITVVRYFNVYGPAQDWRRVIPPVMSAFITKLMKGEQPVIYGNGEKRRDFIYVEDVNSFHRRLIGRIDLRGRTYNVGSGVNYSVLEMFDLIEGLLKTGLKPVHLDELPGEAEVTLADIGDGMRDLDWDPQVGIIEGLKRSIAYLESKVKTI